MSGSVGYALVMLLQLSSQTLLTYGQTVLHNAAQRNGVVRSKHMSGICSSGVREAFEHLIRTLDDNLVALFLSVVAKKCLEQGLQSQLAFSHTRHSQCPAENHTLHHGRSLSRSLWTKVLH